MPHTATFTMGKDDGGNATLVIGSLSRGGPAGTWTWGMMMMGQTTPPGCPTFCFGVAGYPTADARNQIVQTARERHATFLWMVDDDVAPLRTDAVRLMMSTLGQNLHKGVRAVTGVYVTKNKDCREPLIFDDGGPMWQWKLGQIFPVKSCGAGCLLISMSVFEEYGDPWFKDEKKGEWFVGEHGREDIYFCDQMAKLGYSILCDSRVLCAHIDEKTGDIYALPEDSYPLQKEPVAVGA